MDDAYNNKNLVLKDEDDEEDPSNDLDYVDQRIEDLTETETKKSSTKLDYSLQTKEERNALVTKIIAETPPEQLTPKYLEILADYIVFAMDKEERRGKKTLTPNRMVTINKRETSYEGLVAKLENGEDGIYGMISDLGKNILFTPKNEITQADIDEIPGLKELRDNIQQLEEQEKLARGKRKFLLKKQIIEMRQDQYVLKNEFRKPIHVMNVFKGFNQIDFDEHITINDDGTVSSDGIISFFNPKHISALLCNYSKLKENAWGVFNSDGYYMMEDLDRLIEQTLKDKYPLYYDLLIYKIDGKANAKIQSLLFRDHHIKHSVEYISCLWRNKIPKLLAEQAQENYIMWYYTTQEKGKWKKCGRCGKVKLAHNRFFSRNNSSKDGWYSICKECRNTKIPKFSMDEMSQEKTC